MMHNFKKLATGERLSRVYKRELENPQASIYSMFGPSHDNALKKVYRQKSSEWNGEIPRRMYRYLFIIYIF